MSTLDIDQEMLMTSRQRIEHLIEEDDYDIEEEDERELFELLQIEAFDEDIGTAPGSDTVERTFEMDDQVTE